MNKFCFGRVAHMTESGFGFLELDDKSDLHRLIPGKKVFFHLSNRRSFEIQRGKMILSPTKPTDVDEVFKGEMLVFVADVPKDGKNKALVWATAEEFFDAEEMKEITKIVPAIETPFADFYNGIAA